MNHKKIEKNICKYQNYLFRIIGIRPISYQVSHVIYFENLISTKLNQLDFNADFKKINS